MRFQIITFLFLFVTIVLQGHAGERPYIATTKWTGIAYGNEKFVAIGSIYFIFPNQRSRDSLYGVVIATSQNSLIWKYTVFDDIFGKTNKPPGSIIFDSQTNNFIITSSSQSTYLPRISLSSPDGEKWRVTHPIFPWLDLANDPKYSIGTFKDIKNEFPVSATRAPDGLHDNMSSKKVVIIERDKKYSGPWKTALKHVAFGNELWVGVTNKYHRINFGKHGIKMSLGPRFFSTNQPLGSWQTGVINEVNQLYSIAYGNGWFIAVGYQDSTKHIGIARTQDGIHWESIYRETGSLYGIAYGKGSFVAIGDRGIYHSNNEGMEWKKIAKPRIQGIDSDINKLYRKGLKAGFFKEREWLHVY